MTGQVKKLEEFMKILRENFFRIINDKGINQGEAAERCGIAASTLSRIINGKKDVQLSTLIRISEGLGVEPWELFLTRSEARPNWPLSEDDKTIVFYFRKIPSEVKRQAAKDMLKALTE